MAYLNRPFTGRGYKTSTGTRVNYSWCTVGTGPTDASPLIVEHGGITTSESSSITNVGTTAYNGWTDSYASPATITGAVEGFVTASDGTHTTDPVSVRAGTKMYLIVAAGTWSYEGWILISSFDVSANSNDMVSVKFGFTFKTAPVKRTLGIYQGGACVRS